MFWRQISGCSGHVTIHESIFKCFFLLLCSQQSNFYGSIKFFDLKGTNERHKLGKELMVGTLRLNAISFFT